MICQACGLDKKILVPKNEDFLYKGYEKDIFAFLNKVSNSRGLIGEIVGYFKYSKNVMS